MLTGKITLPDSPHLVNISKNPGFRALYLAIGGLNSVLSFNKYKKCIYSSFLAARFWKKKQKFSVCPKNDGFARVRGGAAPMARTPMTGSLFTAAWKGGARGTCPRKFPY